MSEIYLYSAKTGGIYPSSMMNIYENSINGVPDDLVVVEEEKYKELMAGQQEGKRITPDGEGYPILSPQAKPTKEETIASNTRNKYELISSATELINPLQDAVDLEVATEEEKESLKKWKLYRIAVNRIDIKQKEINWPEIPA